MPTNEQRGAEGLAKKVGDWKACSECVREGYVKPDSRCADCVANLVADLATDAK